MKTVKQITHTHTQRKRKTIFLECINGTSLRMDRTLELLNINKDRWEFLCTSLWVKSEDTPHLVGTHINQ